MLAASPTLAQPAPSPPAPLSEEQQQILQIYDEYVAAEVAHDEALLHRLIDNRFVFNSEQGTTSGKDDFPKRVLKLPQVRQTVRERTVLIEGDTAFVFATTDMCCALPGKPEFTYSRRYTCAYVKQDRRWRMLVLQMQDRAAK